MIYRVTLPSPLGGLTLESDGDSLTGLWIEGQKHFPGNRGQVQQLPVFAQAADWLERYFEGQRPDPSALPLKPEGTAFQQRVWQALQTIPYGETLTYGALAKILHCGSAQAIGQAVSRNPISILIPCHRVTAAGGLGGYDGGADKKLVLLELEKGKPEG